MHNDRSEFHKRHRLRSQLKLPNQLHKKDFIDQLFSNAKIAAKKKSEVELIKTKSGQNKKYSNLKAYTSIPLLNNFRRFLPVDVVWGTKNNKYDLILKNSKIESNMRAKSSNLKLNIHSLLYQNQNYPSQNVKRIVHTSHGRDLIEEQIQQRAQVTWQTRRLKQSERSKVKQKIDERPQLRHENLKQKQQKIDHKKPSTSSTKRTLQVKSINKSDFMVEGTNLISYTSPVWIIDNFT